MRAMRAGGTFPVHFQTAETTDGQTTTLRPAELLKKFKKHVVCGIGIKATINMTIAGMGAQNLTDARIISNLLSRVVYRGPASDDCGESNPTGADLVILGCKGGWAIPWNGGAPGAIAAPIWRHHPGYGGTGGTPLALNHNWFIPFGLWNRLENRFDTGIAVGDLMQTIDLTWVTDAVLQGAGGNANYSIAANDIDVRAYAVLAPPGSGIHVGPFPYIRSRESLTENAFDFENGVYHAFYLDFDTAQDVNNILRWWRTAEDCSSPGAFCEYYEAIRASECGYNVLVPGLEGDPDDEADTSRIVPLFYPSLGTRLSAMPTSEISYRLDTAASHRAVRMYTPMKGGHKKGVVGPGKHRAEEVARAENLKAPKTVFLQAAGSFSGGSRNLGKLPVVGVNDDAGERIIENVEKAQSVNTAAAAGMPELQQASAQASGLALLK